MTSEDEIREALQARASRAVFGASWSYVEETGSTNDLALRAAEQGSPEGTTCIAGAQTAGRGRHGRSWHSPPGAGLYVSTIVRQPRLAPWITLAAGVAVAEGIRTATGLPVQLKWPNDVVAVSGAFRSRRKLAGILAEGMTTATGVQYVVLGFGINVTSAAFPPELADRAGSLESELGRPVSPARVLTECLDALDRACTGILTNGPARVLEQWRHLAPSAEGRAIEWEAASGWRRGVSAGLADDGALLARAADAGIERIISGEVRWLD